MTDSLDGLSAELRKAAKTTEEISDLFVRNAGEGTQEKVFRLKWLPAVLVEKEMQRIGKVLKNGCCLMMPSCEKREEWKCGNCKRLRRRSND